jgi:HSP20 family protein
MVVSLASHHSRFHAMAKQSVHWMDDIFTTNPGRYSRGGAWAPAINLYEEGARYWVVAELAGVDVTQVELRVQKDALLLVGHRDTPQPRANGEVVIQHMEIDHGNFARQIHLPPDADPAGIEACYRNGMLWVCIPKKT